MRYRQQQDLVQRELFAQATLCDYVFEKSRLFAYLNLDDSDGDGFDPCEGDCDDTNSGIGPAANELLDRYGRLLQATAKSASAQRTGWLEVMPDVLERARRLTGRGGN